MEKYKNLIREAITGLTPYIPGKPIEMVERELGIKNTIKLASNETALGPSPMALEAMQQELMNVNYYPEDSSLYLREKVASKLKIHPDMLVVSNGAHNVIWLIGQTFINEGDEVLMADLTFPSYDTITRMMGGVPIKVPLKNFANDLEEMKNLITKKTKLIFLCNPNNPTGAINTRTEFENFINQIPKNIIIVMDEAYFDFVDDPQFPNSIDYINEDNPIIGLRTFSKISGLAGIRVGYSITNLELTSYLRRVVEPFPTSRLAQVAALAALDDEKHYAEVVNLNSSGKAYYYQEFEKMGLRYVRSQANFVFVEVEKDVKTVFQKMMEKGIIIRPTMGWKEGKAIRITIGLPQQNEACIKALKEVLAEI
jgi:histidinol-phosphate aminotransferase